MSAVRYFLPGTVNNGVAAKEAAVAAAEAAARGARRRCLRRSRRRRGRRRHLEIQLDIQARKLYLEVFLWFWTPGERSRRMETGVLHRISLRVS